MPSARALLVASLLTEPPYGCLGPSGNDRYRKRSLRSQTVGASQVNCQVAAALRNESITNRRVRAGAIGGSTAMTRTAFCRQSPRVPSCWLGSWAVGTSEGAGRESKIKALAPDARQAVVCTSKIWRPHAVPCCQTRLIAVMVLLDCVCVLAGVRSLLISSALLDRGRAHARDR